MYGVDWDGPLPLELNAMNRSTNNVRVPQTQCVLSPTQEQQLRSDIDPLQQSENFGIDIYINTVLYVQNLLGE